MTAIDRTPTAADIETAVARASEAVAALVKLQAAYDSEGFRIAPPRQPLAYKTRHMNYHLRKALQRLDNEAERIEHAEYDGAGLPSDSEVAAMIHSHGLTAAELLFGALQMAEIGGFDLVGAWRDLIARNAKHFIPETPFAELEQVTYREPLEGGPPVGA